VKFVLLAALLMFPVPQLAAVEFRNPALEQLLAGSQQPEGVVFEIMVWEDDSWAWAAPMLKGYVERLRHKYSGLDIVLISHGAELFDLTHRAGLESRPEIRQLADLEDGGVEIYVDGEYARWKRLEQRDFLEFVEIAASGSAQLTDYVELGYAPIKLEPSHAVD
jgi:intracellular sulfur oxidation DsrE/DsrF family protein